MSKTYIALIILATGLAIGILLIDKRENTKEIELSNLAVAYNDQSRFVTTDHVTERLIENDPTLLLIDVRPNAQFKHFSIPGAVNIPIDSLLEPSTLALFKSKFHDKVLYSNSDVLSDQAWLIYKRLDLPNVFVMRGGVNLWFNNIVKTSEPLVSASSSEFDLYSFRQAANQYFYGIKSEEQAPAKQAPKVVKKVPVIRSAPAEETGGGC